MEGTRRLDDARFRSLAVTYMAVKRQVLEAGFAFEVDWQDQADTSVVAETDFLREAAWVILSLELS